MTNRRLIRWLALPLLVAVAGPATAQDRPTRPTRPLLERQASLPNPILYLIRTEGYTANGKEWVRHVYDVFNKDAYPAEMFAAAPTLPACGNNANASRSWVDVFDAAGTRLYGFCALGSPGDLGSLWFATEADAIPPSYVYIEINDRQTNTKYRSNLADTVM